jgi:hypothetical protein
MKRDKGGINVVNKIEGLDLQHDMKKRNNKPGCNTGSPEQGKVIREGKEIVRTRD